MSTEPKPAAPKDSAPNNPAAKKRNEAEYNANVPVDLISPDPKNRDKIDPAKIEVLADSIKAEGLLQPIVLRVMPKGGYQIIAGEHRWRAYQKLKLQTIAAKIYRDQSELDATKKKVAENALRVELTAIEKAKRYQELQSLGASQAEIGVTCGGLSQPVIANALRLLTLPADVQALISAGVLSEAHGVSLVRFAKWPAVCSSIAKSLKPDEHSSKWLNQESLPFHRKLINAKLVLEINTWSYDHNSYTIPASLMKEPGFFLGNSRAYYILPPKGEPNLWEPERQRQQKARIEKEAAEAKKAVVEKKKEAGLSKEAIERKKKIAKNKAVRLKIKESQDRAVLKLKAGKGIMPTALNVILEAALSNGHYNGQLDYAAEALGYVLPKGDRSSSWDGYGRRFSYKWLAALGAEKFTKLVALAIIARQCYEASRFVSGAPECAVLVAEGKGGVK